MAIDKNEVSAENLALALQKIPDELRERAISTIDLPVWNDIPNSNSARLALAKIFVRATVGNPVKEKAFQLLKEIIGDRSWMFVFEAESPCAESVGMYLDLWCENITVTDWLRIVDSDDSNIKYYSEKLKSLSKPLEWWWKVYEVTRRKQESATNRLVMRKILSESQVSEDFQKMISENGFSYLTSELVKASTEKLKDYPSLFPFYKKCNGIGDNHRLSIILTLVEMKKTFDQCHEVFDIIPRSNVQLELQEKILKQMAKVAKNIGEWSFIADKAGKGSALETRAFGQISKLASAKK
jgi:hypothetical protein